MKITTIDLVAIAFLACVVLALIFGTPTPESVLSAIELA